MSSLNKTAVSRFDRAKAPIPCKWFLRPLLWLLCLVSVRLHKTKITKTGMEGVKGPYILLGNHNAFYDMKVSIAATFPQVANYVVAIDGFIGREGLLRAIGCICKRKFTNDPSLIRHLHTVVKQGGIIGLYPEARYSLCGTTAVLPESLGKLCKILKVPVVTLICHGNHVNHPFWNTRKERGVRGAEAEMKPLLTAEELAKLSPDEINARILKEFQYDDFRWQKEHGIRVTDPNRAVGLEKVLYQCPCCGTEYRMKSDGTRLFCDSCGAAWQMTELGELRKEIPSDSSRDTEAGYSRDPKPGCSRDAEAGPVQNPHCEEHTFTHIPDWYEWERENVRREVRSGTYTTGKLPVTVESLPNARRFLPLGEGTLVHNMEGFHVRVTSADGTTYEMEKPVSSMYSCHIEYAYLFQHGDCVDLNTLDDTWYIYPKDVLFSVTKMALATEELYYAWRESIGKPCKEGLA